MRASICLCYLLPFVCVICLYYLQKKSLLDTHVLGHAWELLLACVIYKINKICLVLSFVGIIYKTNKKSRLELPFVCIIHKTNKKSNLDIHVLGIHDHFHLFVSFSSIWLCCIARQKYNHSNHMITCWETWNYLESWRLYSKLVSFKIPSFVKVWNYIRLFVCPNVNKK